MATVNYTLRVDEADKNNAEQVFRNLGMTFAAGINIYLKTVGMQQKIPFDMDINDVTPKKLVRKRFKEAFEKAQRESIFNGTDEMTMDEIDDIIAECRREE
jgi:addiction module RelB/DinJ family antitoxin